MRDFIARHAKAVIGTLCGFDRLVFRGTLRLLAHRGGMMNYLASAGVLLKGFTDHAMAMSEQLKEASVVEARRSGRPVRYLLSTAIRKEEVARQIAGKADLAAAKMLLPRIEEYYGAYGMRP